MTIVDDVRERGDEAVREWALRLDGAEPGMVAVHALVPAKDVWQLLPRLEAVGAFSILVVPVERMLR